MEDIKLYPIVSRPFGLSYSEWSTKWWKWLLSIPREKSPAFDLIGVNTEESQTDPNVFFLCQTIEGVNDIPFRRSKIPRGRAIYLPIINWISVMGIDGNTDSEMIEIAREKMDVVSELQITLNGISMKEELKQYRFSSAFFELILPEDNILGLSEGRRRFVSDGYWVMTKPISAKNVHLSSMGSCSSGSTRVGIFYDLFFD